MLLPKAKAKRKKGARGVLRTSATAGAGIFALVWTQTQSYLSLSF